MHNMIVTTVGSNNIQVCLIIKHRHVNELKGNVLFSSDLEAPVRLIKAASFINIMSLICNYL